MNLMRDVTTGACGDLAAEVIAVIRGEGIANLGEGFGVDDDLFLAGIDSMALMQLLVALEERFGIAFGAEDVTRERFRTAAVLAAVIESKRRP